MRRTRHQVVRSVRTGRGFDTGVGGSLPPVSMSQVGLGLGVLGVALTVKSSVLQTDAGYLYVVQTTTTGDLDIYSEPGIHFRLPFFSTVTAYPQVMTVALQDDHQGNSTGSAPCISGKQSSVTARFADTYIGRVPASFRFRLSGDPEKVIKMHKEFRNSQNLVDSLLVKNAQNVTIITATQYTGEEFFQGGLNMFKNQLEDQLRHGIYSTERRQVEEEVMGLASVSSAADQKEGARDTLMKKNQMVWKTVPVRDAATGLPKRAGNPLQQYGITVTQVTIGDPKPEEQLEVLLRSKKKLVAERITAVQQQETAKAQSMTEQLKKEIQRTREVQDAQRQKELLVISAQREVEVAKQVALRELVEQNKLKDMSEVTKLKELQIAQANRDIYKANSEAAVHQAKAITATGTAEANVLAAKYKALGDNKSIYLAEMQRDTAKVLYENLPKFQVQMPKNYVSGDGAGRMASNLDVITGFSALGMMQQAEQKQTPGWFEK